MFKLSYPQATAHEFTLAAAVAKVVELIDLKMLSGEFSFLHHDKNKEKKKSDEAPYEFGFMCRFNDDDNQLEAMITIEGRDVRNATGEGAAENGLRVKAVFLLTYKLMVEPPPEDVRGDFFTAFSQLNGLMNVWPYFREFAHEAARRMGVPNIIVPVLRVEPASESTASKPAKKEKPAKVLGSVRAKKSKD